MLVISRRIGESFLIGDNVEATVVDITGDKVVLGVQAPRDIAITRIDGKEAASGSSSPPSNVNAKGYGRQYHSKRAKSEGDTK